MSTPPRPEPTPGTHEPGPHGPRPDERSRDEPQVHAPHPDGPAEAGADVDDLEFGPSGYLPPKASARARKIVLRAPLGIQWVVGAVVAGIVVVVAGVLWWSQSGPPAAPFVATVAVAEVDGSVVLEDLDALVVTAGGPVVVFADATDLALCEANGRIEGRGGVWSASTGRGFGVESLARHPTLVHDGVLFVDPTTVVDGPTASSTVEPPGCD